MNLELSLLKLAKVRVGSAVRRLEFTLKVEKGDEGVNDLLLKRGGKTEWA